MKKMMFAFLLFTAFANVKSQEVTAKEKAAGLAKNSFSKIKHEKKETHGVTTKKTKVIASAPVSKEDAGEYAGNYWCQDLRYKIEIRLAADKGLAATLGIPGQPETALKNVVVKDAYFSAVRPAAAGKEESWEGVFIARSTNGNTEFGLGIKPANPVVLEGGIQLTKLFFKKVSP